MDIAERGLRGLSLIERLPPEVKIHIILRITALVMLSDHNVAQPPNHRH
jgi:hypothetical protein